jgi:leader peptidase (prepilin peptidase)/N-methyltransferase
MTLPEILIYIFLFAFGAVVGSFLNVCIHRIPIARSIVSPGSHCPECGSPIRFYDNIPIISYIVLAGRCRVCKAPISPEYLVVETLTAAFTVIFYLKFGLSMELIFFFLFIASLIVITFIDLRHRIIPDVISLPGIGVGLAASTVLAWSGDWPQLWSGVLNSIIGIVAGGGVLFAVAGAYYLATGKEGMGGGDIKLLAMIGAFLGWKGVMVTLFTSSFAGAVVGGLLMLFFGKDRKYAVPFGPFLAMGAVVHLLSGEGLIDWYILMVQPL